MKQELLEEYPGHIVVVSDPGLTMSIRKALRDAYILRTWIADEDARSGEIRASAHTADKFVYDVLEIADPRLSRRLPFQVWGTHNCVCPENIRGFENHALGISPTLPWAVPV